MASPLDWNADYLADRRQLRRKLTAWRVAAFAALVVAIAVATWRYVAPGGAQSFQAHVARVAIEGIITGDRATLKLLDDVAKSKAEAVIVTIESPGGTTTGAERLHDAIRKVAERKPVVAVVRGMAASGGYIAAIGADRVIAQGNSLVGSIGVLFQFPNVGRLLETVGVKMEEVKSSPLKASPNGLEPTSPEARAAIEALVRDSYDWFKGMVGDRRKLDGAALDRVADGRVFTGRQSVDLRLIDEIGDEKTAVAWLATKGIEEKTPVRDWQLKDRFSDLSFLHLGMAALLDSMGLKSLAQRFAGAGALQTLDRLNLDGLLALWHPLSRD